MASLRKHTLLTAYTILFTTASGILGYDLCTHRPRSLPDLPIASTRVEPIAQPARLAPAGVFYLTARVNLTDDSGVRALKPGTRVKLLQREGATLTVTDSLSAFLVDASQVTNDMDVAEALIAENSAPGTLAAHAN